MENIQRAQTSNHARGKSRSAKSMLATETWTFLEDDLWLGPKGVIVNQAALEERKFYYTIVEVR
jgi:hypothetical protein